MKRVVCLLMLAGPTYGATDEADAYRLFQAGKFKEAEPGFAEKAEQAPDSAAAQYNLGVVKYRQGQFEEAKKHFGRAADLSAGKDKSRPLFNMGNSAAKLNDFKGAVKGYQDALSFDLENKAAAENLSWAQEELKKAEQQKSKGDENDKDKNDKGEKKDDQKQADQDQKSQENKQDSQKGQDGQPKEGQQEKEDQQEKEGQQKEQNGQKGQEQKEAKNQPGQKNQEGQKPGEEVKPKPSSVQEQKAPQGEPGQDSQAGQGTEEASAAPLSADQLQKQDAERLLRSVDDKMGKYLFRPSQDQLKGRSKNGKDW